MAGTRGDGTGPRRDPDGGSGMLVVGDGAGGGGGCRAYARAVRADGAVARRRSGQAASAIVKSAPPAWARMRFPKALLVASLLATALSGCLSSEEQDPLDDHDAEAGLTSVFERAGLPFDVSGDWSLPLEAGVLDVLPSLSVYVDIPLPPTEGGGSVDPAGVQAHLGLFLPDVSGCDFTGLHVDHDAGMLVGTGLQHGDMPTEPDCRVPVIADVGPYWGTPGQANPSPLTEGDVPATERGSGRLGEWLISTFVPHGYAVAQVSVLGTGQSDHCFDMFGLAEQLGVHHAVEWLGTQPWSNGNVGLIGRSYDGSTPWMAAAHGSEHLKTIVPISGLSGLQDLVTWNGASESRILTFHNAVYGQYGIDGDAGDIHSVCPDYLTATPLGAAAYLTGDSVTDTEGTYWHERSFVDRAVQNYDGSIYLIHGLLDDNVDPHAGTIGYQAMVEKGVDAKAMFGQWAHNYPDRVAEHPDNPRFDWAQDMLEWFGFYLKGTGPEPPLHVEVEMPDGRWRVDDGLQPSSAEVLELPLVGETGDAVLSHTDNLQWSVGVLSETNETVLAGLSTIRMDVTPTGPGGQVYVELYDATTGDDFGLAYGITELRHAPGGEGAPVPGVAMTIEIPFQYFSAALPAGHELGLRVAGTGNDYLPSPVLEPVVIDLDSVRLHLSTLDVAPEAFFQPPTAPAEA